MFDGVALIFHFDKEDLINVVTENIKGVRFAVPDWAVGVSAWHISKDQPDCY